jgi:hypothetical protein
LAGAELGATIGSIFPGVGTVIGTVIGATVGVAATFFAFKALNEAASPKPERTIDDPGSLAGATPGDVEAAVPKGWVKTPTRDGDGSGTRWLNPNKPGQAVRVMPGKASDPNPVKQGPYVRVSKDGKVSDPVPLSGNPTLKKDR